MSASLARAEFNATVTQRLISMGRCSSVAFKELFVPPQDLQGALGPAHLQSVVNLQGAGPDP